MASTREASRPYRQLNTSTYVVISVLACAIGAAMLILSANTKWFTGRGAWEALFQQVGSSMIVAAGPEVARFRRWPAWVGLAAGAWAPAAGRRRGGVAAGG
jgi:hypothetical protein